MLLNVNKLHPLFDFAGIEEVAALGNGLTGQDVISVSQFDLGKLEYIFSRAREMREMVERVGSADLLKGFVLACLFYEPSTRTSSS